MDAEPTPPPSVDPYTTTQPAPAPLASAPVRVPPHDDVSAWHRFAAEELDDDGR